MIDFLTASAAYEITKKNEERLGAVPLEEYKKIENAICKAAERGNDSVIIEYNSNIMNSYQIDTIIKMLSNNGYVVSFTKNNWESVCYNTYKLIISWRPREIINDLSEECFC